MIQNTRTASAPNPFESVSSSGRTSTTGFDAQLSQALTESLNRLGVSPGTVNISITRNSGSAANRILITWDSESATGASTSPGMPASGAATEPAQRNPFAIQLPPPTGVLPRTGGPACSTPWCPYDGPSDSRDQIGQGGGNVTESGAPLIAPNAVPARNQWNYAGLAALNPYFTTPSNPLREGYVLGFNNWFTGASVYGGNNGPVPANRLYFATQEGAQEALRLVRQYEPSADITQYQWGGGPFSANNAMFYVTLPGGRMMNAGLVLAGYYNHGYGVTVSSDADLARAVQGA